MTSIIKVDNLQNQCGANIISESANVITIGASGDTVTLAAGASQSGFGRSGSVNWDTTPKTTTPVTAVSGNGYFINTTSIAITVNLPATPAAGDIVAIADYANTSATNNITVGRNGSKIDGETIDAKIKINGQVYTLVYVDATEGWKTVGQTFNQISTAAFVAATGGTILTCGDFKTHVFTGPGTFTVSCAGNAIGSNSVEYLVVAGGGGGGVGFYGGGAGAGGYRQNYPSPTTAGLPVTATGYPITVGAGTAGSTGPVGIAANARGSNSIFSTITSTGGGGGGNRCAGCGQPGGSGGGKSDSQPGTAGTGNTPPVSPPQGNDGGNTAYGSGGGGASAVGGSQGGAPPHGGIGGAGNYWPNPAFGATAPSYGTPGPVADTRYFAGGGAGGTDSGTVKSGGAGGGGAGGTTGGIPSTSGTTNTGGGGGGGGGPVASGAAGGSGIVVIRYKFQ
jgi:hypothetical protein